jgi:hypothetical protein
VRNKMDLKKPHHDEQLASLERNSQDDEGEGLGQYKSAIARFAEFSKLSAKMVDLSLQEAQRDLTPRTGVKDKLAPLSSPLPGLLTEASRVVQPPIGDTGSWRTGVPETAVAPATPLNVQQAHRTPAGSRVTNFAVLYSKAKVTLREITNCWSGSTTTRKHIGHVMLGAQRIAFLIGHWSRMLTAQAPVLHVVLQKRFALAQPYRCPDCGREIGFRSRPRNLMECYILPLVLMQPVRCAACFRRDYKLIFTHVGDRSRHYESSVGKSKRNAA